MRFLLGLGPGGLGQGSESLSWNYFGCGSERQSHVIDSGGSNLCLGERDCSPSCLGHLILSQCGLGSYG